MVRHRQGLGVPLGLVVHATRPDRVHIAPVGFRLRVDEWVAVHLARRREQEARALPLREAERIVGSVRADLQRRQRQPQVVDRARGAREVIDEIDGLRDLEMRSDVVIDEHEAVAPEVLDVLERAGLEVVDADDPAAVGDEGVAEIPAKPPPPEEEESEW